VLRYVKLIIVSNLLILKVAVNVPLSREFDYLPLPAECPPPGCRVLVPFGRRNQVGLVLAHASDSDVPKSRMRQVIASLDDSPILSDQDIWLLRLTSHYYHHPIGEVVAAALPALLRKGKALHPVLEYIAVTDAGASFDIEAISRRAPRQAELLELLRDAGGNGLDVDALNELLPTWRRAAKPLLQKGLISRFESALEEPEPVAELSRQPGPKLNEHQSAALEVIRSATGFGAYVLDGVTGSGKTEVYLQLMQDALDNGRQVLVLAPEIGLTPQLVSRLRSRLGVEPVVLHSKLTDLARLQAWRHARSAAAKLVVGTRSAVFTPLPDLGRGAQVFGTRSRHRPRQGPRCTRRSRLRDTYPGNAASLPDRQIRPLRTTCKSRGCAAAKLPACRSEQDRSAQRPQRCADKNNRRSPAG